MTFLRKDGYLNIMASFQYIYSHLQILPTTHPSLTINMTSFVTPPIFYEAVLYLRGSLQLFLLLLEDLVVIFILFKLLLASI